MTKEERKKQIMSTWNAARKAKRESAQVSEGRTNAAAVSGHAGVEQMAESSTMGAARGAVGGEFFLPDPELPFSTSEWAVETEEPRNPFGLSEEDNILRSSLLAFLQDAPSTEAVSGSDEAMVDAPANEQDSSTLAFPDITYGPQEINPGALAPAFNEDLLYGSPADTILHSVPTQLNAPSSPRWEHRQLQTPSPTLEELIESANAITDAYEATLNIPSPPGYYATGPDAMALSDLPASPPISPGPSNQTAANILTPLPLNMASPQVPAYPSLPEITAETVLLLDAIFNNGSDSIESPQDAQQYLQDGSELPDLKEPSEREGN